MYYDYGHPAPGMAPEASFSGMRMFSNVPMDKNFYPHQQVPGMSAQPEMNNGAVQGEKAPGMTQEAPNMYGQFGMPYMYPPFQTMYGAYP